MGERNHTGEPGTGRTHHEVHLILFSIALGLLLILGGLFVILFFGEEAGSVQVFGVPLIIGGLLAPHLAMRVFQTTYEISGPCPYCWSHVKTSDSAFELNSRTAINGLRFAIGAYTKRKPTGTLSKTHGLQDEPSVHRVSNEANCRTDKIHRI